MFQFSRFAQYSYVFTVMWPTDVGRVSPFGNPRIKVSLQTPRDLSHATTSFIASHCLGIHRMRLFTWPYNPNKSAWCVFTVLYGSAFFIAFFCFENSFGCAWRAAGFGVFALAGSIAWPALASAPSVHNVSPLELVAQPYHLYRLRLRCYRFPNC